MFMPNKLSEYLGDRFLNELYASIRKAGGIRSISVDITNRCNLRCKGCYFFSGRMDLFDSPADENEFDLFIRREKGRGTNFITVVGGEPALELKRLKKLYDNFNLSVATNGLIKIPYEGFENLPIGVAVWGNNSADMLLRGNGKINAFETALKIYKNDERAFFYYTTTSGNANQIEEVVTRCVQNGNRVLFNFYSDKENLGDTFDHRNGFEEVHKEIIRMIELFPEMILMSPYVGEIVSSGKLYNEKWGYDVCTNFSTNNPINSERMRSANLYSKHFRAYNADLKTTRQCCTSNYNNCDSCYDVWQHFSWIILNMRKHLSSKEEFTNWLTTAYLFYLINHLVDYKKGIQQLKEIQLRLLENHKNKIEADEVL
jgi:4Fe-4S single cluster domain